MWGEEKKGIVTALTTAEFTVVIIGKKQSQLLLSHLGALVQEE